MKEQSLSSNSNSTSNSNNSTQYQPQPQIELTLEQEHIQHLNTIFKEIKKSTENQIETNFIWYIFKLKNIENKEENIIPPVAWMEGGKQGGKKMGIYQND